MKIAPRLVMVLVLPPLCTSVFAQDAPQRDGPPSATRHTVPSGPVARPLSFDQLDLNSDGVLTSDEVKGTPAERSFSAMDINRDGVVSRREYLAAQGLIGGRGPNLFQALDADGDGVINRDEASADPALYRGFDRADADGNGLIDRAELSAFEAVEGGPGR